MSEQKYDAFKIIEYKAPLPWDVYGLDVIDSDGDVVFAGKYGKQDISRKDVKSVLKRVVVWTNLMPYITESLEEAEKTLPKDSEAYKKVLRILERLNTNLDDLPGWRQQFGLDSEDFLLEE